MGALKMTYHDDLEQKNLALQHELEALKLHVQELQNELEIMTDLADRTFNGEAYDYLEFLSEHSVAEHYLTNGIFLKPHEINFTKFSEVIRLLERHVKGETSKNHTVNGEFIDIENIEF